MRWLKQHGRRTLLALLLCLFAARERSAAQQFQFLPEINAYYRIQPDLRLDFQAKETREAGDPTQAEIGPSIDYFLKPLLRLKDVTEFDLNDAESRPLQLSAGFRYIPSADAPTVWRMQLMAIPRVPLFAKIWLADRNRFDLDWSSKPFEWRYRNRVDLQRNFAIRSYHLSPYLSAEAFYQSQYHKWSTTALYAGSRLPITKHFELNPYYEHQNITSKHPNQQLDQFGLILNMYFGAGN
ncbi:MAG TPA: DUF2490 domain-containing protein [Terriglobales bacterium]